MKARRRREYRLRATAQRVHNLKAQRVRDTLGYKLMKAYRNLRPAPLPQRFDFRSFARLPKLPKHNEKIEFRKFETIKDASVRPACQGYRFEERTVLAEEMTFIGDAISYDNLRQAMRDSCDAMAWTMLTTGTTNKEAPLSVDIDPGKKFVDMIRLAATQNSLWDMFGSGGRFPLEIRPTDYDPAQEPLSRLMWRSRFHFRLRMPSFIVWGLDVAAPTVGGFTKREVLKTADAIVCLRAAETIAGGTWAVRCAEDIVREARG